MGWEESYFSLGADVKEIQRLESELAAEREMLEHCLEHGLFLAKTDKFQFIAKPIFDGSGGNKIVAWVDDGDIRAAIQKAMKGGGGEMKRYKGNPARYKHGEPLMIEDVEGGWVKLKDVEDRVCRWYPFSKLQAETECGGLVDYPYNDSDFCPECGRKVEAG